MPKFTPAGLAYLKNLKHLRVVDFAQTWAGPTGVESGDEVARQVATMPQLESVEGLSHLSAEGIKTIAALGNLKGLGIAKTAIRITTVRRDCRIWRVFVR